MKPFQGGGHQRQIFLTMLFCAGQRTDKRFGYFVLIKYTVEFCGVIGMGKDVALRKKPTELRQDPFTATVIDQPIVKQCRFQKIFPLNFKP